MNPGSGGLGPVQQLSNGYLRMASKSIDPCRQLASELKPGIRGPNRRKDLRQAFSEPIWHLKPSRVQDGVRVLVRDYAQADRSGTNDIFARFRHDVISIGGPMRAEFRILPRGIEFDHPKRNAGISE